MKLSTTVGRLSHVVLKLQQSVRLELLPGVVKETGRKEEQPEYSGQELSSTQGLLVGLVFPGARDRLTLNRNTGSGFCTPIIGKG